MSTPTSSRISDSDRYGHWGDDRLYGEDRLDDCSRDEWWRPQSPGAGLMHDLLWAMPAAVMIWLAMTSAVFFVFCL